MNWKHIFRALLRRNGLDIRRLPRGSSGNGYYDQSHLLHDDDVIRIFDVGARVGDTAALYRSLFPAALIDCFEPFSESFATLSERFRTDPLVACHRLAISDRAATKRFYCNQSSATNSLLRPSAKHREYVRSGLLDAVSQAEVVCLTIDDFCHQEAIDRVSILKLDIQGAELQALEGCRKLLQTHGVGLVYSEVLFADLYDGQAHHYQVGEFLSRFGYSLYGLYDIAYADNGTIGWCDALFLSPQLRETLEGRSGD